jgi:hypothetical protein
MTEKRIIFSRHLKVDLADVVGQVVRDGATRNLYEIPIALTGTWVKNEKEFSITKDDLRRMVENFEKRKNDQVVVDYEHASERPEVARGGPIPAAGWIHGLSANGILRARIEWTATSEQLIREGQYRFFSPAIDWGQTDKETGKPQGATLTSGALTNHPFLEELPPITLLADVDPAWAAGQGVWFQPHPSTFPPQGGSMVKGKRLKIKRTKMDDGSVALDVFDGDAQVGSMECGDLDDVFDSMAEDMAAYRRAKGRGGDAWRVNRVASAENAAGKPDADAEVVRRTRALLEREKLPPERFGEAMQRVLMADRDLERRYRSEALFPWS